MTGDCSVCSRLDIVAEIDAALVQKAVSRSAIARQYGIGRESLRRHKLNHLAQRLRTAAKASQAEPATELLERILQLVDRFHGDAVRILDQAAADGKPATALKALAEIRKQIQFMAELRGLVGRTPGGGGPTTVNVFATDLRALDRIADTWKLHRSGSAGALPPASAIETTATTVDAVQGEA